MLTGHWLIAANYFAEQVNLYKYGFIIVIIKV